MTQDKLSAAHLRRTNQAQRPAKWQTKENISSTSGPVAMIRKYLKLTRRRQQQEQQEERQQQ